MQKLIARPLAARLGRWTAAITVLLAIGSTGAAVEPVFPGKHWQTKKPAEVGLDKDNLDEFVRLAGGRGCVVRFGYLVHTWGDPTRPADIASASKVFYSHLLFGAIEDGRLSGVDEKVVRWQPDLARLNPRLGYKDRKMTFRHLANQTACLGYEEAPGTAFDYNDLTMGFFWDTLVGKVYGIRWKDADARLFRPKLAGVLQFEDKFTCNGPKPGRPNISPRDFARFGLLYLNHGKWRDRQVLDAKYVKMAVSQPLPLSIPRTKARPAETCNPRTIGGGGNQCDHNGGYSWLWWLNTIARDGRRWFPHAPPDQFMALGHSGRRGMAVMPKLQLIVSFNDTKQLHTDRQLGNRAFKILAEAAGWRVDKTAKPETSKSSSSITLYPVPINPVSFAAEPKLDDPKALPGQIIVDPEHPMWLKRNANPNENGGRHVFICGPGDPEGFLYLGNRSADGTRNGDQLQRIRKLIAHGGNCIYIQIVRSHGGDAGPDENPFVDSNPAKGLAEDILDQWETWFTLMDNHHILIYLFFYDDGAKIWKTGDRVGAEEKAFLKAIVGKFQHHRNLIWIVGEESEEAYSNRRVRAIAEVIARADDHNHIIGNHHLSGTTFKAWQPGSGLTHYSMQYGRSGQQAHAGAVEAWNKALGKYQVIYSESTAVGSSGDAIRKHAWASAMGGLMPMLLGMNIDDTSTITLNQCRYLQKFFEATDFYTMAPHDELAQAGTRWVLANPGRSYIAYTDKPSGKLGLKDLKTGRYDFTWLDCTTGKTLTQKAVHLAAGNGTWPKPAGIGNEAAVWIRVAK